MAAFAGLQPFLIRKRNKLRILMNMSTFSNSPCNSKGEKFSLAAIFLGCVGLAGLSGICFKTSTEKLQAKSEDESNEESNHTTPSIPRAGNKTKGPPLSFQSAIDESRSLVQRIKEEFGCPGVCVAVSVNGETVWSEGFGFADIENGVVCSPETVMRIASISKPLTATAAAKLCEEGKLDFDAPIQTYVSSFPEKTFHGVPATITTRHLLSHLGGIRSYKKGPNGTEGKDDKENISNKKDNLKSIEQVQDQRVTFIDTSESESEFLCKEYLIKEHYESVTDALSLFKDDPLLSAPGNYYSYTTHGWTLISAVIEHVANQNFLDVMKKLFKDLGMENTYADFNENIIHNRARFYQRNKKGHLVNAPYVDNSYKWGGGGFLSTVGDLVHFGNCLLYARQIGDASNKTGSLPGFLRLETVTEMWKIVANTEGKGHKNGGYGLGWAVVPEKQQFGACNHQFETILHSGAAIGCSSFLLIRPTAGTQPPKGVVVALLVNLQEVHLEKTAMAVAASFQKCGL